MIKDSTFSVFFQELSVFSLDKKTKAGIIELFHLVQFLRKGKGSLLNCLRKLFLFSGLNDMQIGALIARLPAPKRFSKGETIYDDRHFERAIGVFLEGRGAAQSDGVVRGRFAPGATFGAAAVFGAGREYVSRIVAQSDCLVQFLPEAFLRECILNNPVCAENYVAFLSEKIRYLNQKIRQYTAPDTVERVYRYLCALAGPDGKAVLKNLTEVTRLLGMGRTSLYRALGELEQRGRICRDGNLYRIVRKEL